MLWAPHLKYLQVSGVDTYLVLGCERRFNVPWRGGRPENLARPVWTLRATATVVALRFGAGDKVRPATPTLEGWGRPIGLNSEEGSA